MKFGFANFEFQVRIRSSALRYSNPSITN